MRHVVLLGDSIFDNGSYVPGEPAVIDQLRSILPSGWKATLLAVDGDVTADVSTQLNRLPDDATHLVISTGGNDSLGASSVLQQPVRTVREALLAIHDVRESFRNQYRTMLEAVRSKGKRVAICTVYDTVPGLDLLKLQPWQDSMKSSCVKPSVPNCRSLICDWSAMNSPIIPPSLRLSPQCVAV